MTREEFRSILGEDKFMTDVEMEEIEKGVQDGTLACFDGPNEQSEAFIRNPVKIPVTQEMIDKAKGRCGIL